MENIQTLTQLLSNSQCEYQIFDLGRRIKTIEPQVFADVEKGQCPYPFPMQRKAHLAIAYWNEQKQPWIWFLRFELDERGQVADLGRQRPGEERVVVQVEVGERSEVADRGGDRAVEVVAASVDPRDLATLHDGGAVEERATGDQAGVLRAVDRAIVGELDRIVPRAA